MPKMSGAKFIAETLKGYGVTHIFFVEAIIRRALVEMEVLGIRRILTHTEKAAAYMADGYARVRRGPGICGCQSVGAANLAAGLQDAYLGLSPVIAITGRKPPFAQYRNAYQEIIHRPLFQSVTKFSAMVDTAEQMPYVLRQAFREATSGAPGPVHLDMIGRLGEVLPELQADFDIIVEESFTHYPPMRPQPEAHNLEEAARALRDSERPVIVAGGGAAASSAGPEIQRLAETLSIPVATSLNAKEILLDNHPLNVGLAGEFSRWCANQTVAEADLVLFIGSHTGDMVTNYWKVPKPGTPVIQIDIDPLELGRNYPNTVSLLGDAKVTVGRLVELVDPNARKDMWARRTQQRVQQWRAEVEPLRKSDSIPIRPERLCEELTKILPADGILVADTGWSGVWTGVHVYLSHPKQRYIRAAGSLGWAFPAALGAKCAAPDQPVVCFTGDGGFWYHLGELETALRCGIKTVTVVNNNHGFSQCRRGVYRAYGDRQGNREDLLQFKNVNFAKTAQEWGCLGIRVEDPQKIREALRAALGSDLPAVVDVVTDPESQAPDGWAPVEATTGF